MSMKIAVTDESRGKCLKLNFTIIIKHWDNAEQLSTVYNIDNLAEVRFKFVYSNNDYSRTFTFISLKKHALAKDSAVKVKCQDDNSNHRLEYVVPAPHPSIGSSERPMQPPRPRPLQAQRGAALLQRGDSNIPNNSRQWLCTENWIEWQEFNKNAMVPAVENCYYSTSTVNLTVIKEKSFTAEKIYEDGDFTDFTLNTSDGSVSVHKAWLSAHSDVFKAMLCQEWKETAEGHVKIDGVTLQTLQHLKQYMYLGTLPDDGLRSLLLLAMYYMMDELKSECISKLARTASSENLDDLLNFAAENKVPELTFAILEMTPRDVVNEAYTLRNAKAVSEKESLV